MELFKYTAKDKAGTLQKGDVEAENESAAAKVLLSRDLVPIDVFKEEGSNLSFLNKISLKEKVIFSRQLATMINAGLPITQSLQTMQQQAGKQNIKKMLEQIVSDLEGGSTLSNAFSRFPDTFNPIDITLIRAGESSGTLDKALLKLAGQLEKEQSLLRKVRSALIYPAFLVVAVIAVVAIMVTYVMPQMETLYSSFDAQLPLITRVLISISHAMTKIFPFLILGIIGLVIYLRMVIKRPFGRKIWDNMKIKVPGLGDLMKKLYMARFSNTLSSLVASGVPLLDGLNITSKAVGNVIYQELIIEAAEKVKSGVALSEPLKENPLFPPVVSEMVAVGEKTGELDAMLQNLADYFEEEVEVIVKNLSNLIEPLMIVVLGGIIGIILVAIMMPIYGFGSAIYSR